MVMYANLLCHGGLMMILINLPLEIFQISSKPHGEYCPGLDRQLGGNGQGYHQQNYNAVLPKCDQGYGPRNQGNDKGPINLNIYTGYGESENPSKYGQSPPPLTYPLPSPSIPPPAAPLPTPSRNIDYKDPKRPRLFTSLFSIPGVIADNLLSGEVII